MAEDIVKLLSRLGSPVILVFDPSTGTQFQGNPFTGAQNTRGWEHFAIFDRNRRLSRKRYEIGPWLLWNVDRKSYALYRMVTFLMICNDLAMTLTKIFGSALLQPARSVCLCLKTRFSSSRYFWSRISHRQSYYCTLIWNDTYHIEWYNVWWPWLTFKRVAR